MTQETPPVAVVVAVVVLEVVPTPVEVAAEQPEAWPL
jgi:hypothetical protein